jgi:proton-coupled amino acid transporter
MWTLLALSFVYVGFSTLGYCAFGSHVGVMITISLEDSAFPSGFIRFFWAVAVVFTFPLQMFPVSELADKLFFGVQPPVSDKPDQMRMLAGTVIRCCLVVLVWLMAVAGSKHLGHFIALVGESSKKS